MRARDQSSIFSTGRKFRPDYGLLLELHAFTLVARSYVLLIHVSLVPRLLSPSSFWLLKVSHNRGYGRTWHVLSLDLCTTTIPNLWVQISVRCRRKFFWLNALRLILRPCLRQRPTEAKEVSLLTNFHVDHGNFSSQEHEWNMFWGNDKTELSCGAPLNFNYASVSWVSVSKQRLVFKLFLHLMM